MMYTRISTFVIFTILIISALFTTALFTTHISVTVLAAQGGAGKNTESGSTSNNRLSYNGSPVEDSKKLSDCESKAAKDGSLTKQEVQDCYSQIRSERAQAAKIILNSIGQLLSPK
jgi:hypothetical protein